MALLSCDFFSEALEVGTSMTVLLPQPTEAQIGLASSSGTGTDVPVLYLLHGLSDDHTAWLRYTSIERYAAAAGLAVVMPAAGRSFYADEVHGHRYFTYLAEELPRVVASFFRVSTRREDTFVAGLSRQPDRRDLFARVYGGSPSAEDDLFALLTRTPAGDLPRLRVIGGSADPLLDSSRRFVDAPRAHGADVTADFPHGEHEWGLWDRQVQEVLDWLPVAGSTDDQPTSSTGA